MAEPIPPRIVVLTPMQRAVIGELTRDGATDTRIAHRLGISPYTVKSHMKAALRRTDAESRTQLVVMLLRRQIAVRVESRSGENLHTEQRAS